MHDNFIISLLIKGLVKSLLITEILELIAAACFPRRNKRDFLLVFLVNIITNPVVVYLDFMFRFRMPSVVMWIVFIEGAVWLTESLIFKKFLTEKHNPFLYAFVLNASSYFGGELLQILGLF